MAFGFDIDRPGSDERAQRRVAHNQATLRMLNEAMRGDGRHRFLGFRCECGQLGCNQLIPLRRAEYEAVRAHARRFAIVAGHEVADIEDVIEHHGRYAIVETRAPAAIDVAERTVDSRASGTGGA